MENEMKELLINGAEKLNIHLSFSAAERFLLYKSLLQEWNEKINLTAITDDREIVIKHFLDSLSICGVMDMKINTSVIDVGTGAGFPGLPIQILHENANVTLLDSLNKRLTFLADVVEKLALPNVRCIHARAEDGARMPGLRDGFDYAVSRAVARLSLLAEYCLPYVKPNGAFIAMKGPSCVEEINEAKTAVKLLGGEIIDVKTIEIPYSDINHTLITIKKNRQTPSKYPRNSAQMAKTPIV